MSDDEKTKVWRDEGDIIETYRALDDDALEAQADCHRRQLDFGVQERRDFHRYLYEIAVAEQLRRAK